MPPRCRSLLPVLAFSLIFFLIELGFFLFLDRPLAAWAHSLTQSYPAAEAFFAAITDAGKAKWFLWPFGIMAIFCGFLANGKDVSPAWKRLSCYIGARALFLFTPIAVSGIVVEILKFIAGRARPRLWFEQQIYGFDPFSTGGYLWHGMPSGHTTTAFALAFSLIVLYPSRRLLWLSFGILIAVSRIAVDAHYLSDVCAGALLGWLTVRFLSRYTSLSMRIFYTSVPRSPEQI